MTPLEVLRAAREKIATPERWTQKSFARNATGACRSPWEMDAVCWCMNGSLTAVNFDCRTAYLLLSKVVGGSVWDFNDMPGRTHAEVLAAFDKAIAIAVEEEEEEKESSP